MSKRKQERNRFRNRQKERQQQLCERQQREFAALVASLDPDRILYLPLDMGKPVLARECPLDAGRYRHRPPHPPS